LSNCIIVKIILIC